MKKFEYMVGRTNRHKRYTFPKEVQRKIPDGVYLTEALNLLGEDGWELVSFEFHPEVQEMIFKRERVEPAPEPVPEPPPTWLGAYEDPGEPKPSMRAVADAYALRSPEAKSVPKAKAPPATDAEREAAEAKAEELMDMAIMGARAEADWKIRDAEWKAREAARLAKLTGKTGDR